MRESSFRGGWRRSFREWHCVKKKKKKMYVRGFETVARWLKHAGSNLSLQWLSSKSHDFTANLHALFLFHVVHEAQNDMHASQRWANSYICALKWPWPRPCAFCQRCLLAELCLFKTDSFLHPKYYQYKIHREQSGKGRKLQIQPSLMLVLCPEGGLFHC